MPAFARSSSVSVAMPQVPKRSATDLLASFESVAVKPSLRAAVLISRSCG
jgi:hypothetical protein